MRAAPLVPLARYATALGIGAFLVYCGAALQRSTLGGTQDAVLLVVALAVAAAGAWALLSLPTRRAAAGTAALLGGVVPIVTFLGWQMTGDRGSTLDAILWVNLLAGLVAAGSAGWLAARGPGGVGGARRSRVARV